MAVLSSFEGESGFGILLATVAEKFFRELIVYRDALDNGWLTPYGTWSKDLPPDVRTNLDTLGIGPGGAKSPWMVKRAISNARAFSLRELRVARFRLLHVREQLVTSSADEQTVITELLRILPKPRVPARPVTR
jgi:hypothetical protein